ncbi:unnamed protein product [Dibothriocephalus latus]|uniref:Uncharacterized protein n=1 Tax=Dibothriocephalus latus TaxID=60516 RepID=A0A3P7NYZ0_DIBLA|nr:unnamed protein product [Dibothriocephalus latus]
MSHGPSIPKTVFSRSSDRTTVLESVDFRCCLKASFYIDIFILDAIHGRIPGYTTGNSDGDDPSTSPLLVPTWEKRGYHDVTFEKPFLSESGAMATHKLLCAFRSCYPAVLEPPGIQEASQALDQLAISERLITIRRVFFRDLFNALLGQESQRFQWDPDPVASFFWQQQKTANLDSLAFDISIGCLRSCLSSHLIAATAYRRLDDLVRRNMSPAPSLGYVHTALMYALSQWLRAYAVAIEIMRGVLSSSTIADLHSLSQRLSPLVSSLL